MKNSAKSQNRFKDRSGLTLIELMITVLIATLVVAGIGVVMIDTIKAFPKMYERTTGNYQRQDATSGAGVIPDAYVARATFDSVCRKASKYYNKALSGTNDWVTVYYYSSLSPTLTAPDKCAKFIFDNTKKTLTISNGTAKPPYDGTTDILPANATLLASYVTNARFDIQGNSVIMAMTIDNSTDTAARQKLQMTVTCAAEMHDE
jgi:hypothetical protein